MRSAVLALLVSAHAQAYQTGSAKWTQLPVRYFVDANSATELGASVALSTVNAAYAGWAAPACSAFRSSFAGTVSGAHANGSDGNNTVLWRYDAWPPELGGSSVIGLTTSVYSGSQMVDADIQLNGVNHKWTTNPTVFGEVDAQSILAHEIGHQLGLKHSADTSATMYGAYPGGTSQRSLALDDIAGVCALYPSGSTCTSDAQCTPGDKCLSGTCTQPPPVSGSFGDPCTMTNQCMSNLCVADPSSPNGVCTIACVTAQDCPSLYDCLPLMGGGSACVAHMAGGGMSALGDPCQSGVECGSGLCVAIGSGAICSQACVTAQNCPSGYGCVMLTGGEGACLMQVMTGDPCTAGYQCPSGLCVGSATMGVCVEGCDLANPNCPSGQQCRALSGGAAGCIMVTPRDMAPAPLCDGACDVDASVEMNPMVASGGCAVGGGRPDAGWMALLLLGLICRKRLWVVVVLGLAGCGGDPALMREISPPLALRAPPGAGLVVFVRPSRVASFRHCEILDENGNFLGRSWARSHFAVAVPPGRHMFVSWGEDTDAIDIDVAPGKTYFVEVAIQPGFWSPSYQLYAITPRISSWWKREEWMHTTRQMAPEREAGQMYLNGRVEDVHERLRRGRKHLQEYQGTKEQERHTIRAEEGI